VDTVHEKNYTIALRAHWRELNQKYKAKWPLHNVTISYLGLGTA
jgi:hypothetical protein